MTILDFVAFLILWWSAAAALAGSPEVTCWRGALMTTALLVLCVSSFVGMVASAKGYGILMPWTRGVVHAGAVVALFLYQERFGITRHARLIARDFARLLRLERHA